MIVITNYEEIINIEDIVNYYPEVERELLAVDFDNEFIIGVFQGVKGSTGFGVDIKTILLDDHKIEVYADFIGPGRWTPVGALYTSPYQVIRVPRENISGTNTVQLIVGNEVIISQDVEFP
ncbi:MAG: protease complex subunit PrcB family protein [Chloroflexota bacterium]|nr:MAG: protease complex subunit PrcB family protein [Chloroflexota bacterium]